MSGVQVNISLRVLTRPIPGKLPSIYRTLGTDYAERVLPSIIQVGFSTCFWLHSAAAEDEHGCVICHGSSCVNANAVSRLVIGCHGRSCAKLHDCQMQITCFAGVWNARVLSHSPHVECQLYSRAGCGVRMCSCCMQSSRSLLAIGGESSTVPCKTRYDLLKRSVVCHRKA